MKDLYAELVEMYRQSITELTPELCDKLISHNIYLGKGNENEEYYIKLFEWDQNSKNAYKRWSAYYDLLHFYVRAECYEKADEIFHRFLNDFSYEEMSRYRFDYLLIDCCEIIANVPSSANELWKWAKPHIKAKEKYGKLYEKAIVAAESVGDSYVAVLKSEYEQYTKKYHS